MAVTAKGQSKRWEISAWKIAAISNLATSYSLISDSGEDAEGQPPILRRGLEPQHVSFDTFLSDAAGVSVKLEIQSWRRLIGQSAPLYIGGRRFGPRKLMLADVSISDTLIDDFGRIRQASLSFSFTEDAPEDAKSKQGNMGGGQTAPAESALQVGAPSDDKADLKPVSI